MSSKLSSVLVQQGVVPVRKVEEAIQRQVIYGGSLGTNLLEMGALDEAQLLSALSLATGLPSADYGWVLHPDPEAQKVFPRRLIDRYHLIPARVQAGLLLCLAMQESPDEAVLKELSYMLGLQLQPHVVPEIRYLQALELHLSVGMRPRYRNLLRRLDHGLVQPGVDQRSLTEEERIDSMGAGWELSAAPRRSPSTPHRGPDSLTADLLGPIPLQPAPEEAALAAGIPGGALTPPPQGILGPPGRTLSEPDLSGVADSEAYAGAAPASVKPPRWTPPPDVPPPTEVPAATPASPRHTPSVPLISERAATAPERLAQPPTLRAETPATQAPAPSGPSATRAGAAPAEAIDELPDDAETPLPRGLRSVAQSSVDAFRHLPADDVRTRPMRAQTARAASGAPVPAEAPRSAGALVSLSQATALLDRQQERDAMLRVALSYLVHLGDAAYVLVVRGDRLRGHISRLQASGEIELLSGLSIQFSQGSQWHRSWHAGHHHVGPPTDDELCRLFYRRLGRPLPDELLNVPVQVRSRSVVLLVVERQRGTFDRAGVPEVLVFAQRLAGSIERLIMQRKKERPGGRRLSTGDSTRSSSPAPPVATPSAPEPTPAAAAHDPLQPAGRQPRLAFPSMPDMRVGRGRPAELPSLSDIEITALTEPDAFDPASVSASTPPGGDDDWDLLITPPDGVPAGSAELPSPESLRALRPLRPPQGEPSLRPSGGPVRRSERHSFSQLVTLLGADETRPAAMEALRDQGAAALDAFMRYFPGPILIEREGLTPGRYPPVEEHGPLLSLLAEMGEAARPRIVEELGSPVIANRFYATLLAGRLGVGSDLQTLVERLYDPVRLVRQAAREALRRFVDDPGFSVVRARLATDLDGDHGSAETLRWASEAAATFREPAAVAPLVELIRHPDRQVALAAHQSLREITRHDYGSSQRGWRRWHRKNRSRERLQWLIDALVQDDRELAERAAQELHRLTGQRIPLDVNGPKKEWKRAQREWLDWYGRR